MNRAEIQLSGKSCNALHGRIPFSLFMIHIFLCFTNAIINTGCDLIGSSTFYFISYFQLYKFNFKNGFEMSTYYFFEDKLSRKIFTIFFLQ
jgi:hypothetical protein